VDAAGRKKVLVCHRTDEEDQPYVLIEVSVRAIPAHAAHGDTINPDFANDPTNCGACGVVCESGQCAAGACTPVAVVCTAWTLSGGESPDDGIWAPGGLSVSADGASFFNTMGAMPPNGWEPVGISFVGLQASHTLEVSTPGVGGVCSIGRLYLHCVDPAGVPARVIDAVGTDSCSESFVIEGVSAG
jgi:hypothetical protein